MKPLPIRVRLTGWYLAVICLTFVLSSLGMYLGMLSAIQHTVDRQLSQRTEDMRQFLWRHRAHSESEMPQEFRKSSGVQPGEELYQVMDSSGNWVYQAPSMQQLAIPGQPADPNRPPQYVTIFRRYTNIRVFSSTVEVSGQYYLVQVATVLSDLLPCFGTKLSMICAKERGRKYVEKQSHGGADDRGAEAIGGRA